MSVTFLPYCDSFLNPNQVNPDQLKAVSESLTSLSSSLGDVYDKMPRDKRQELSIPLHELIGMINTRRYDFRRQMTQRR